jgi:hypothetical protein
MRLRAITCDILSRPVYHFAATSPHTVDVAQLSASLHAEPLSLRERIQAAIDVAEGACDSVVLAYGLCGGATAGLEARSVPLVLPRAHDCVTVFLGSRARYRAVHERAPGTYWYVQDQLDRGNALKGWLLGDAARSEDVVATRAEYVARFGESNADYLMETLGEWRTRYERGAFLDTGLAHPDATDASAGRARQEAERRGWRFERVASDLDLVRRLLHGEWDADFQVLEPGQRLEMSFDEEVVTAVPVVGVVTAVPVVGVEPAGRGTGAPSARSQSPVSLPAR